MSKVGGVSTELCARPRSTMMRKTAPVRQLSLHVDTPQRRRNFRKQFSEDVSETKDHGWGVSAKKRDNPPVMAKQAWLVDETPDEGMVVKKCKEVKRPLTSKLIKQTSLNKESILLSHQELAERLRQAWKEREKEKQNLKIFLNHNVKDKSSSDDLTDSECAAEVSTNQIKKTQVPVHQETTDSVYKSIFQKRMRRTHSVDDSLKDYAFPHAKTSETKIKSVVVVPLVESLKLRDHPASVKFDDARKEDSPSKPGFDENKPINVIIRPMTAVSKREAFRSRVSSAFNTSTFAKERPPLIRSSSVPLKQASPKPNFVAVKRRLKSASKKKEKSAKVGGGEVELQRFVSASATGPDVVTMVSLVSPEESDCDEQIDAEKTKPKVVAPISKPAIVERHEKNEIPKNYNFRKAVKSVSFQQSSIHAVRSFSASFPARRGPVATTPMLSHASFDKTSAGQEKRATLESGADDVREPKRRLLRAKSATPSSSVDEDDDNQSAKREEPNDAKPPDKEGLVGGAEPDFDTPKEKQCWEMYRKMSGKGISISFETILRGMLTPTEYRLRRKSAAELEIADSFVEKTAAADG